MMKPTLSDSAAEVINKLKELVDGLFKFRNEFILCRGLEAATLRDQEVEAKQKDTLEQFELLAQHTEVQSGFALGHVFYEKARLLTLVPSQAATAEQLLGRASKFGIPGAWTLLGECLYNRGDLEAAATCFNRTLTAGDDKVALRNLSMLMRALPSNTTEQREDNINRGVEYARRAVKQDAADGQSWMVLGNSLFASFFAGNTSGTTLKACRAAYGRAEQDKATSVLPELHLSKHQVAWYEERYNDALESIKKAWQLEPTWSECEAKRLSCVHFLKVLLDMVANKGNLSNKRLQSMIKNICSSQLGPYKNAGNALSGNVKPKLVMFSQLSPGTNHDKIIQGMVISTLVPESGIPFVMCLVDGEETCLPVSVYNWAPGTEVKIGDAVAVVAPVLKEQTIELECEDKADHRKANKGIKKTASSAKQRTESIACAVKHDMEKNYLRTGRKCNRSGNIQKDKVDEFRNVNVKNSLSDSFTADVAITHSNSKDTNSNINYNNVASVNIASLENSEHRDKSTFPSLDVRSEATYEENSSTASLAYIDNDHRICDDKELKSSNVSHQILSNGSEQMKNSSCTNNIGNEESAYIKSVDFKDDSGVVPVHESSSSNVRVSDENRNEKVKNRSVKNGVANKTIMNQRVVGLSFANKRISNVYSGHKSTVLHQKGTKLSTRDRNSSASSTVPSNQKGTLPTNQSTRSASGTVPRKEHVTRTLASGKFYGKHANSSINHKYNVQQSNLVAKNNANDNETPDVRSRTGKLSEKLHSNLSSAERPASKLSGNNPSTNIISKSSSKNVIRAIENKSTTVKFDISSHTNEHASSEANNSLRTVEVLAEKMNTDSAASNVGKDSKLDLLESKVSVAPTKVYFLRSVRVVAPVMLVVNKRQLTAGQVAASYIVSQSKPE